MERLLEDAEKIKAANGEMVEYSIDSFADMVDAIHVVQENMGITGTTALEASTTIEGSVNSMKAAWENLATGMADETADMEQLTQNFVESVGAAADNIIPRIKQIVKGVASGVSDTVSYLRTTNSALGKVVTVLDDVATAAIAAGSAIVAIKGGKTVSSIATVFKANAEALAYFTEESGKAAVAQAALNGEFTAAEVAIGVITGKISLATAAQAAWNAVASINPYILIAAAVAGVAVSIKKFVNAKQDEQEQIEATNQAMADELETSQEAYEKLQSLRQAYKALYEERSKYSQSDASYQRLTGEMELVYEKIEVVNQAYNNLRDSEIAAAEAADAVAEATAKVETSVNTISTAADTYVETAQGIVESWFNVYDTVYGGLYNASNAFTDVAKATTMSYDDMMASLDANIAFNERYSESLDFITAAADSMGINIDALTEYLAGMSATDAAGAMEGIRAKIEACGDDSEAVAEVLGNLNTTIEDYGVSAEEAGYQMAQAVVDVKDQMQEAFDAYTAAIQGLDNYSELYAAAKNSMDGVVSGINNRMPAVLGELDDLAGKMKSKLSQNFENYTLTINAVVNTIKDGSHASGLDYVPFDGYIAELHKGETVLTAEQAAAYRAGVNSYGQTGGNVSGQLAEIVNVLGELLDSNRETTSAVLSDRSLSVDGRDFGRLVRNYA